MRHVRRPGSPHPADDGRIDRLGVPYDHVELPHCAQGLGIQCDLDFGRRATLAMPFPRITIAESGTGAPRCRRSAWRLRRPAPVRTEAPAQTRDMRPVRRTE